MGLSTWLSGTLRKLTWTRNTDGSIYYSVGGNQYKWCDYNNATNLEIAQNHPILTPAILFVAKLFSQAEFKIVNKRTKKEVDKHWILDLLNKPNSYQTKSDFLESSLFMQIAQGRSVCYLKKPIGLEQGETIYVLDSDKIKFPKEYCSSFYASKYDTPNQNIVVTYDEQGENLRIPLKDLVFFYDLPNAMHKNFYEVNSRLDGLRQTLINTVDSLIAKNIILKTNGKEMISSGGNEHLPLVGEDKKSAEELLQNNYGLGWNRKRGIVTKANLNYQSMHIALRDLGLDESVKVDGNLIYTALHIPKDILSLEAKKTTYNNFKESMVSYVQNEMQSTLNSFVAVLQQLIKEPNLQLVGTFENLPIMQHILKEKFEAHRLKAVALQEYLKAGFPTKIALDMLGFDKNIELDTSRLDQNQNNGTEENNQEGNNQNEEDED